ncbi:MAG: hypothetical protein AAF628_22145 [Planctomycetota bacterium]
MNLLSRDVLRVALVAALAGVAQGQCSGQGSRLVPGSWEEGPVLGCPGSPGAVAWRVWTPQHRQVVPQLGSTIVQVHTLPRLIVVYRCSDDPFEIARPVEVRTFGYVFDVEVAPCGTSGTGGGAASG